MRVLIVDDSVFMRTVIRDILTKDPAIEVVGTAIDGVDALAKIRALAPDLITLDIEMPRMNGLEVLKELGTWEKRPKTLMLSSLTSQDAEMTRHAIELGADDFMLKPKDITHVRGIGDDLIAKVKHMFTFRFSPIRRISQSGNGSEMATRIVMIGSSAGGPQQLDQLLMDLPADLPAAVVVTQHMPPGFTAALAERFNRICPIPVRESQSGDPLEQGRVLVSKSGYHSVITANIGSDGRRTGRLIHSSAPPLHGVRPAIDKIFISGAPVFGKNAVSVILSGMGNDAGEGAAAVKKAGGTSLICREEDCLVYGMARSAIEHKAVDQVVPLKRMAKEIVWVVSLMEG